MSDKIDLNIKVFNKDIYTNTIDTKFRELGVTSINEDLSNNISIEDFFDNYNKIFYQIPKNGNTNSHEYLIKTSGEYVNFETTNEQIIALQQEISDLREENLKKDMQILEIQINQKSISGSINM